MCIRDRAYKRIIQTNDFANRKAYAYAELGVKLDYAMELVSDAIRLQQPLLDFARKGSYQYQYLRERLSHYQDTLGWVYHQQAQNPTLNRARKRYYSRKAEEALKYAIELKPDMLYGQYHLSRHYQMELEKIWQQVRHNDEKIAQQSEQIREYLRLALHHLRTAQELDQGKRLYDRVIRLQQRIDQYRTDWNEYLSPKFSRQK